MTYDETEIVADAGVRLRIIADGLIANARVLEAMGMTNARSESYRDYARHVDEVRVRLCALPIESEGEAAYIVSVPSVMVDVTVDAEDFDEGA